MKIRKRASTIFYHFTIRNHANDTKNRKIANEIKKTNEFLHFHWMRYTCVYSYFGQQQFFGCAAWKLKRKRVEEIRREKYGSIAIVQSFTNRICLMATMGFGSSFICGLNWIISIYPSEHRFTRLLNNSINLKTICIRIHL